MPKHIKLVAIPDGLSVKLDVRRSSKVARGRKNKKQAGLVKGAMIVIPYVENVS